MRSDLRGVALALAVLLGLGMVVIGARSDLTEFGLIERDALVEAEEREPQQQEEEEQAQAEAAEDTENLFPDWFGPALLILYVALVVAGFVYVILMMYWGRPLFPTRQRRAEVNPDEGDIELHEELAEAIAEGLRGVEEGGEPRDAVIACWVRLERAAARAGTARWISETSEELASRVLAAHHVTPESLRRLEAAYREARYSSHTLDEEVRHEAREALARVSVELERRRAAAAGEETP